MAGYLSTCPRVMIIPTGFNFINMFWEAFVWKCIKGQNTFIIQNLLVTCWWKWPQQNSHISVKVQGAVQGNVWVQVCLLSIMRSLVQVVSQQVSISLTSFQELLFFLLRAKHFHTKTSCYMLMRFTTAEESSLPPPPSQRLPIVLVRSLIQLVSQQVSISLKFQEQVLW